MHMTNLPNSPATPSSRRTRTRLALCAGVVALAGTSLLVGATPGLASAASLPKSLAKFAHCPVDVTNVQLCLFSSTTSTTFQIGSTVVSSTSPATISLGVGFDQSGQPVTCSPMTARRPSSRRRYLFPGACSVSPALLTAAPRSHRNSPERGPAYVEPRQLAAGTGPGLMLPIDVLVSTPTGLLGPTALSLTPPIP